MTTTTKCPAQEYVNSLNIEYHAIFVPLSQSRNAGESQPTLNWRISFDGLTTDYSQGVGHLPNYSHALSNKLSYGKAIRKAIRKACESGLWSAKGQTTKAKRIPEPSLISVLYCLVLDADVLEHENFESWAYDFGYDEDSIKAKKIYTNCLKTTLALRQLIDIDAAREAFQDY